MKTKVLYLFAIAILFSKTSFSQFQPAIVMDWADYIGYQDTIIRIPVIQDSNDHIITAGFTVDSITGPDIMVAKYKMTSELVWQRTYSSAGYNRDQATALAIDDSNNVYVAGSVFSSTTNYDFVILKYDTAGILQWSVTYNGSANNYDIPSAIAVTDSFVYVAGAANNTGTLLDFVTIQYDKYSGTQNWVRSYDYASLFDIPLMIESINGGDVVVTGPSQETLSDWSYVALYYSYEGVPKDTLREGGTENRFDRVNAVHNDGNGNFYLTGTAEGDTGDFNIKTIKIDAGDTVAWVAEYEGEFTANAEGNGITTANNSTVYVCGKTMNEDFDYILVKYDSLGNEIGIQSYNSGYDDEATAICTDAFGNIIVTGKAQQEGDTYNFYTVAYNSELEELWHHSFDGLFHGNDYATSITADINGNIYVTGQSQIDIDEDGPTYQQVTIKYRTDYFVFPEDPLTVSSSMLFYPNMGQIIDSEGNPTTKELGSENEVYYYTINQNPKIYFHRDSVSFVIASIDDDTATTDTLERITMSFVDGLISESPLENTVHDTDQVLNYFLGHCSEGITGILGSERLVYSDVYNNTDVIFSNNNAGMKFQIIVKEGGDPNDITLHFTGHGLLSLISNSDLKIDGLLSSFIYERPLVYQLDEIGIRISVGWLASYYIVDSANVKFLLGGDYDPEKPLVIECARETNSTQSFVFRNLLWSIFYGGDENDINFDIATDDNQNMYATGFTESTNFPVTLGTATQPTHAGYADVFVVKFKNLYEQDWATFYGGSDYDDGQALSVDNSTGDVFITGWTQSGSGATNPFPTDPTYANGGTWGGGATDAFILKLLNDGTRDWANLIPGSGMEVGFALTIDQNENIYVAGQTTSPNILPLSVSQGYFQDTHVLGEDGFIIKFDAAGIPLWNTYFGGDGQDFIFGITATSDELIINGNTSTSQYTIDPLCSIPTDGGFPRCHPSNAHFQSSFGGGQFDDFVAAFDITSNDLIWSTFLGGSSTECTIIGGAMRKINTVLTPDGNWLYLVGFTSSSGAAAFSVAGGGSSYNQPFAGGLRDGYLIKFDNATKELIWSTYLGGDGEELLSSITADENNIYLIGVTRSSNPTDNTHYCIVPPTGEFPLCDFYPDNFQMYQPWHINNDPCVPQPYTNTFLAAFSQSTNKLTWSSYFGQVNAWNHNASISYSSTSHKLYIGSTTSNYDYLSYPITWPDIGNPWKQETNPIASGCKMSPVYGMFDIEQLHIGTDDLIPFTNEINIYPNPTQNFINVELNLNKISDVEIKIYDVLGKEHAIFKMKSKSGKTKEVIDISKLISGFYFAVVSIDGYSDAVRKIIKK